MTLTELQEDLALYIAARNKILNSQEYKAGDLSNKRADLKVIEDRIDHLRGKIAAKQGTTTTTYAQFGTRR